MAMMPTSFETACPRCWAVVTASVMTVDQTATPTGLEVVVRASVPRHRCPDLVGAR